MGSGCIESRSMKPTLYIETTIPSYLTAWPSRDKLRAVHQAITREWWQKRRRYFDLRISQLVEDECLAGDSKAAAERMIPLKGVLRLEIPDQAIVIAEEFIRRHALPVRAAKDALHVAIAATNGVHFLLTWNCRHLNNGEIYPKIKALCEKNGCACPVIVTPAELMGATKL